MIGASQAAGLALASVLIIAVPGPSVLFIVGRALAHGRRIAIATVVGNAFGSLVAGVVVAVGLGELLARSEVLFHVIKYAGAAYLVFLGVHALLAHRAPSPEQAAEASARPGWWATARQGLLVGVTNPKVFVLYAAILPQFVVPTAGNVTAQMLLLALVPVAIGLATDLVWAVAASTVRGWFTRSPRRLRRIGQAGGVSIIGLGVATAFAGDPR
ncbi:LysE family translocator [Protaetiibacter larvae]|uniref:LysE family translocator n=1 Tax=Protaetiibacter larvae TaxID=2592654 RepID=A0A5C1Y6J6_9MICO|nr:LysE family translocator [Protaetiibacter larvae]QEO08939.1 LysE family translocator [Protaetiibacter larvae]